MKNSLAVQIYGSLYMKPCLDENDMKLYYLIESTTSGFITRANVVGLAFSYESNSILRTRSHNW